MAAGLRQGAILAAPPTADAPREAQASRADVVRRLLPYLWLVPAFVVIVLGLNSRSIPDPVLVTLWGALTIGLVVPDLLHPFFAQVAKAISAVSARRATA